VGCGWGEGAVGVEEGGRVNEQPNIRTIEQPNYEVGKWDQASAGGIDRMIGDRMMGLVVCCWASAGEWQNHWGQNHYDSVKANAS
jgi:hypothetical protein